ncbi:hypothetical protein SLS57_010588 [Botryosphaeria dothidea]
MTNPTNTAAYLVYEKAHPLEVREAPYPTPGPNEFVIQAHAVAINPADFILQDQTIPFPLPYPYILGTCKEPQNLTA